MLKRSQGIIKMIQSTASNIEQLYTLARPVDANSLFYDYIGNVTIRIDSHDVETQVILQDTHDQMIGNKRYSLKKGFVKVNSIADLLKQ
jgi:hypothetical protein